MNRVVEAEYDEPNRTLRLLEPLEGVKDHEKVSVVVTETKPVRPWSRFEGILEGEDGERFARAIEEAFPIEPIKK